MYDHRVANPASYPHKQPFLHPPLHPPGGAGMHPFTHFRDRHVTYPHGVVEPIFVHDVSLASRLAARAFSTRSWAFAADAVTVSVR